MLSLKSSGMYPDLYILLISLVIICIHFSPMHCSSSAETVTTAGLSFWQISNHSFNLFATDCIRRGSSLKNLGGPKRGQVFLENLSKLSNELYSSRYYRIGLTIGQTSIQICADIKL